MAGSLLFGNGWSALRDGSFSQFSLSSIGVFGCLYISGLPYRPVTQPPPWGERACECFVELPSIYGFIASLPFMLCALCYGVALSECSVPFK